MSTSPLISIVLPVYNGAKYLEFAIHGVLQQTYQNFELIIVNDCSTDSTLSIAESFQKQDSRIRIINNKINLKLPSSLNAGFDSAKGDLFTWTSDDNIHHPNFLEELLKQLTNHKADLVYSDVNIINQDGELKFHNKMGSPEELVYHNSIGASFLYKRNVHEILGGYNSNLFLIEDYDFWLRAKIQNFSFFYFPVALYDYRVHDSSLSSTQKSMPVLVKYRYSMLSKTQNTSRELRFKSVTNLLFNGRKYLSKSQLIRLLWMSFKIKPLKTVLLICTNMGRVIS